MRAIRASLLPFLALALAGCPDAGPPSVSVGPRIEKTAAEAPPPYEGVRLDVIVPVFDPGLPEDPDEWREEGIWPELRRAEANRFALMLKESLQGTGVFGDVRVAPDSTATGDLYVVGTIDESNGEDMAVTVEVIDITGSRWLRRSYEHRVKEEFWRDLRNEDDDPYRPVFDEAAGDIAALVKRHEDQELAELREMTELRFAEAFLPDAFEGYLEEGGGRVSIAARPARNDPMLERTRALRIRDGLFMDRLQDQYAAFAQRTDESYAAWQRHSLAATKAHREASRKAFWQGVVGAALAIGGAVAAIDGSHNLNAGTTVAGIAATTAGFILLEQSFRNSTEGDIHAEALSELGESIDVEIAPQVIEHEGRTVKLTGDTREQFRQWQEFLRQIHAEEGTPETGL